MSGQGYEELNLLNNKIDELINNYLTLKKKCENLTSENEALNELLRNRGTEMKELEK